MVSTIASYQLIAKNMARSLAQTAKKPEVSRDTTYYLEHIRDVKIDRRVRRDYRLFSYAMKAYGLSDMVYAKAFLRKVLTEGISSASSFANKLVDTRYREFAAAFNFASLGEQATQYDRGAQPARSTDMCGSRWSRTPASDNEGVRLALYFERKAPNDHEPPTRSSPTRRCCRSCRPPSAFRP